jgi:hypothetical protein
LPCPVPFAYAAGPRPRIRGGGVGEKWFVGAGAFHPVGAKGYTSREGRGLQDEIHCAESTYPHTPSVASALFERHPPTSRSSPARGTSLTTPVLGIPAWELIIRAALALPRRSHFTIIVEKYILSFFDSLPTTHPSGHSLAWIANARHKQASACT